MCKQTIQTTLGCAKKTHLLFLLTTLVSLWAPNTQAMGKQL